MGFWEIVAQGKTTKETRNVVELLEKQNRLLEEIRDLLKSKQ